MTPGARIAAAIEVLDPIIAGEPADRKLAAWGRAHRFAGSKDRAAIADLVYTALRRRRSLSHLAGEDTGRGIMLALAWREGQQALFSGQAHAPYPPAPGELARLRADPPADEDTRLDVPAALAVELRRSLGSELASVMRLMQQRAPLDLRANLLKTGRSEMQLKLAAEGIETEALAADPAALRVTGGARGVRNSRCYLSGGVEIQDLASQRVARLAGAKPGETVLDYCAGGGGKTLALAMHMGGTGRLLAHDAAPRRLTQLGERSARAGVSVETVASSSLQKLQRRCDLVVADVPCSGSGAWRRTPDQKWLVNGERLAELTSIQDGILDEAARYLRPGGRLSYITCSMLQVENEDRIAHFLRRRSDFTQLETLRLTPLDGGDAFFTTVLRFC